MHIRKRHVSFAISPGSKLCSKQLWKSVRSKEEASRKRFGSSYSLMLSSVFVFFQTPGKQRALSPLVWPSGGRFSCVCVCVCV